MTDWLQPINYAVSTLASGIAIDGTGLTLTDSSTFPDGPAILRGVLWGSTYRTPQNDPAREIVHVVYTTKASTPWTITRAQEGTAAKAWSSGDNFALVLTAGMVDQLQDEIDLRALSSHTHTKPTATHSMWLTPHAAVLPSSNAATFAVVTGTNVVYETLTYADAALRYAWWSLSAPDNYTGGSIPVTLYWLLGAATNTTIVLNSVAKTTVDGNPVDSAGAATGVQGSAAWNPKSQSSGDLFVMSRTWSTALPSASGFTLFRLGRNSTDGLDENAVLLGLKLEFPVALVD